MRRLSLTLFLMVLLLPITSYGTVDYLSVNHITKEYFWGDEDNRTGWVGWEPVPEGQLATAEKEFRALGYERTSYPFKIESSIVLALGVVFLGLFFFKKRMNISQ